MPILPGMKVKGELQFELNDYALTPIQPKHFKIAVDVSIKQVSNGTVEQADPGFESTRFQSLIAKNDDSAFNLKPFVVVFFLSLRRGLYATAAKG